jgi:hypothetical protein
MKRILIIVVLIILVFSIGGCTRDISSQDDLEEYIVNDVKQIYDISYQNFKVIGDYFKELYPNLSEGIEIDWGEVAVVYGVNYSDEEVLAFIPEKSRYQPYILLLDNDYVYSDVIAIIQEDYPNIQSSDIDVNLVTYSDVWDITETINVALGFIVRISDEEQVCYFYFGDQFYSFSFF